MLSAGRGDLSQSICHSVVVWWWEENMSGIGDGEYEESDGCD
jgi:hypothetical protein